MPILAMASYSLIFRRGIARFVSDSVAAGLALVRQVAELATQPREQLIAGIERFIEPLAAAVSG